MMQSITTFMAALGKYDFLQSALITAIMVGVMSGIIGSFIILRGMSMMGDAISHAVLPGVAVAYMLGINVLIGASVFGILAASLIGFVASRSKIKTDTSIGIVFSAFYALGFILISLAESSTNLHHILFGNILAVSDTDMMTTTVVLGLVILFVVFFYKELLITSFDPTFAKTYGLKVQLLLRVNAGLNASDRFSATNRRDHFSGRDVDYTGCDGLSMDRTTGSHAWTVSLNWGLVLSGGLISQLHVELGFWSGHRASSGYFLRYFFHHLT